MKEDYVSFEIAKLLKEKGFDEPCIGFYNPVDGCFFESCIRKSWDYNIHGSINAPTLQMTIKWLREKGFHIFVPIGIDYDEDERGKKWYHQPAYYPEILRVSDGKRMYDDGSLYATPEQAIDAAIKYCLTNLI